MNRLLETGERDGFERQIFVLPLESLDALPSNLRLPTAHFVLFLACDSSILTTDAIYNFASRIIELGAVSVCVWGKDCERAHDIFDEFLVMREIKAAKHFPHIMTTWHADESLDEALWFALNSAFADDKHFDACGSTLIVPVANDDWEKHLQKRLANLRQFNEELVNAE